MDRSIFIFGTSHGFQRPDPKLSKNQVSMFKEELLAILSKYSIEAVSEENNLEAQGDHGLEHSLPFILAKSQNIVHQYCDPTRAKRVELEIRQENDIRVSHLLDDVGEEVIQSELQKSYQLRERYWLEQVEKQNLWPTLLVCGANHVESVTNQAAKFGMNVYVLHEDWNV